MLDRFVGEITTPVGYAHHISRCRPHLYACALAQSIQYTNIHSGDERARIYQLFSKRHLFYEGVGIFSPFDNVLLVREPNNPFDTNSVLVILASNNHEVLGHLERSIAAGIAELMDKFKSQVKIVGYAEVSLMIIIISLFSYYIQYCT